MTSIWLLLTLRIGDNCSSKQASKRSWKTLWIKKRNCVQILRRRNFLSLSWTWLTFTASYPQGSSLQENCDSERRKERKKERGKMEDGRWKMEDGRWTSAVGLQWERFGLSFLWALRDLSQIENGACIACRCVCASCLTLFPSKTWSFFLGQETVSPPPSLPFSWFNLIFVSFKTLVCL